MRSFLSGRGLLLGLLGLAGGGCSRYEIGGLYEIRSVRVNVFDTASNRRNHEFDLTQAVVREMADKGIQVNAPNAPFTLEGRILDIRTPAAVEGDKDVVLVGSLLFRLEIRLLGADRQVVWRDETTESVSFTSARAETFESARQEVFDRLARWVVTHFEKEW